jgi:hypothetical protein
MSFATGCGGGDDSRVKCTNTTECAPDESCEAGICRPACTPGVDCPEKDVSSEDDADSAEADGDVGADGSEADGDGDAEDVDLDSDDTDDTDDTGPDALEPEEELACEGEQTLATYDEGRAFEVRFGERSTGLIALPEGWAVDPICCAPGCCQ